MVASFCSATPWSIPGQREFQAIGLACLVAVGAQKIDQLIAQFIAVTFGHRLDIDRGQLRPQLPPPPYMG